MAIENPHVVADAIEASEFPDLAARYAVMGVPKTVVNERVEFVGAVPEDVFVRHVLEAAGVTG
jgi:predicted DsbA family dithiol-disulfide isomerase